MRIVGYVREAPVLGESETAYAQKERIRRWSDEAGHALVSVCQDMRVPGAQAQRDGYRALLDIVRSGHVDGVLVADLTALSPDKILQEIMIEDLRRRDVVVLSAAPSDADAMQERPSDQTRMVVRDIVERVWEYVDEYTPPHDEEQRRRVVDLREPEREVIVELIRGGQREDSAAHAARPIA